jgi:hypothetical protein
MQIIDGIVKTPKINQCNLNKKKSVNIIKNKINY